MVDVKICNSNDNSSDHLPITIKVDVDLGVKDESNQVIKKFHRFDLNCSTFIEKYNENLEKMMPDMEHYFTKEPNLEIINQFYTELCGTLIRAARTAEKSTKSSSSIKNMSTNRANWDEKLKEINRKVKLVESNLKNSVGIVRQQLEDDLRKLRRERRIENKRIIKEFNSKKVFKVEKLFKYNRHRFWKEISKFKNKSSFKPKN
ncbi:hypothetical protein BpHYR1_002275, partial [Brachionus plicatilis]